MSKIDINHENILNLFKVNEINNDVFDRINGKSYTVNPYISIDDLRYLQIPYYNFDNEVVIGEMICNKYIADDLIDIFQKLFKKKYQINSIKLIEEFWDKDSLQSDEGSMHSNNSSCFNYRLIDGKNKLSNHALGQAIDINPRQNPYVKRDDNDNDLYDDLTEDEIYYAQNRKFDDSHVIHRGDIIYNLFKSHGFTWGGDWGNPETDPSYEIGDPVDYQHFEKEVIDRKVKK